ncbi:RDD family protein [Corynebacterium kroppenstedtii]|uniref:RDD family protein n=1 Tax=Corynebacterium sp. PCR 32 TaxID=3351342 RepID=UPI0030B634B5
MNNSTTDTTTSSHNDHEPQRPALWERGLGYLFDTCVVGIAIVPITMAVTLLVSDKGAQHWTTAIIGGILFFLYRFLMDGRTQGTLGKAVTRITVCNNSGTHLTHAQALKRNVCWLPFGIFAILSDHHQPSTIGSVAVGLQLLLVLWLLAIAVSIYRNNNGRSFLDRWAGAYLLTTPHVP